MNLPVRILLFASIAGALAAVYGGLHGFVLGAAAGALLALVTDARDRLSKAEAELSKLRDILADTPPPVPPPLPAEEGRVGPHRAEPRGMQAPIEKEEQAPEGERPWGQVPAAPPAEPARPVRREVVLSEPPATLMPASKGMPQAGKRPGAAGAEIKAAAGPSLAETVLEFITGGNLLVRTGLIVLFVGIAFLVKYASDRRLLPIEARLIGAALGAMALLAIGWRLRTKRPNYALTLQGGGIGILYLVVFAAFRLYELLPAWFAFSTLAALCTFSAILAILQDSLSLAVFGAVGGFLAPLLTSTGRGSHVMLFSYYAVLDAGILAIAWFRAWRVLNLTGFVFTFGIGAFWGYHAYTPEQFATTEPFLILFFLFYAAIAVLFATRQPLHLKGYVDGTIVFGAPIVAFMEQTILMRPHEYGAALSAVGFAAFYLAAAWLLLRRKLRELDLLAEAFLAIAVGFATLAIPLAFEVRGVASAWAMEGAALIWVGIRQKRLSARVSGLLLQLGAGAAMAPFIVGLKPMEGQVPVLNGFCLGCVLVALAGLFSSCYASRHAELLKEWERAITPGIAAWSFAWWFGAGLNEIDRFVNPSLELGAIACFFAISCAACSFYRERLGWPLLRYPALGLLPAMAVVGVVSLGTHPLGRGGAMGWPVAFAALYYILYENRDMEERHSGVFHAGALWLLALLLGWEAHWQITQWTRGVGAWNDLAAGGCVSVLAILICTHGRKLAWPIGTLVRPYLWLGVGPIAVAGWLYAMALGLTGSGDPRPLPFLPLLNPLDVTVGFAFLCLLVWLSRLRACGTPLPEWFTRNTRGGLAVIGGSIFVWLNTILTRCAHYWGGVPLTYHAMQRSVLVQACFSIFWSLSALCLMVFATSRKQRSVWLTGAGLMAVVVVKLFLVDLSKSGTVERIISFLGVGVLILAVGYLSPVPPQDKGDGREK